MCETELGWRKEMRTDAEMRTGVGQKEMGWRVGGGGVTVCSHTQNISVSVSSPE